MTAEPGLRLQTGSWALAHAGPVSLLFLGLVYYWFAAADRYAVFLYGHLAAQPFDEVTSSRYWMAMLVASGFVLVGYTGASWLLGRVAALRRQSYRSPAWWRVWACCAGPVAVGVVAITTAANSPTLPLTNALGCALAALVGLALALPPGALAAERPGDLKWLTLAGAGLMPCLLLLRALELVGRGLTASPVVLYAVALGSVPAGLVWLSLLSLLATRMGRAPAGVVAIVGSGLGLSYLLLPLAHYLAFTPAEYRYVSASANFFASDPGLQALVLLVAIAQVAAAARLQRWLLSRRVR